MSKLSDAQRRALEDIEEDRGTAGHHGNTINSLLSKGLIIHSQMYFGSLVTTPAGRKALEEGK